MFVLLLFLMLFLISCEQDVFAFNVKPKTSKVAVKLQYSTYINSSETIADDDDSLVSDWDFEVIRDYGIKKIQYKAEFQQKEGKAVGENLQWIDLSTDISTFSSEYEYGTWIIYVRALDENNNVILSGETTFTVNENTTSLDLVLKGVVETKTVLVAFDVAAPYLTGQSMKVEYRKKDSLNWVSLNDEQFFAIIQNKKEDGENADNWTEFVNNAKNSSHLLSLNEGSYDIRLSYYQNNKLLAEAFLPSEKCILKAGTVVTVKGHFSENILVNQDPVNLDLVMLLLSNEVFIQINKIANNAFQATYINTDIQNVKYHWAVDGVETETNSLILTLDSTNETHIISCWIEATCGGCMIIGSSYYEV